MIVNIIAVMNGSVVTNGGPIRMRRSVAGLLHREREKPHKAIPLVNNNANAKTATQNGKTVGEKYFCEFQKKKGFVFQDLPRDTDTSNSSGGLLLPAH